MIRPNKLFTLINSVPYKETGDAVNYYIYKDVDTMRLYLLFQPSSGLRDWVTNFNFPVRPYKHQKNTLLYHGGYCKAWKSANDVIMHEFIAEYIKHQSFTVVISGWSLGGAMAICAAEDFNFRTNKNVFFILSDRLKVCFGNKTVKRLKDCCYHAEQYEHINDIVGYQPPFAGYKHINKKTLGTKFNIIDLFDPKVYHCLYWDETIYDK